jgi:aspartyl-tRNA(Asn)/glutamyl-tRNA(Gln) amidotransferase subunit C
MKIDRDEARRIAALAHLQFDDAGLDRMAVEMTTILEYIETLPSVTTQAAAAPSTATTPLRDDVTRPSTDRELIARNAPEWENGFFVVPAVIESES